MATFEVVDLSTTQTLVEARGDVDLDSLRSQLEQIRDSIAPLLETTGEPGKLALNSIEISLTVGIEGKVWFIAKGTAEASITLTFERPESQG